MQYQDILEAVRGCFASPVPESEADARAGRIINESFERLMNARSGGLYVGRQTSIDPAAVLAASVPEQMSGIDDVVSGLFDRMQGLVLYNHPLNHVGVTPQPTLPSLVGVLYAAMMNTNLIWDVVSPKVCEAELMVARMCAELVGYGEEATGLFTFGGTGTVLYGAKLGIEKALPGAMTEGIREPVRIIGSASGHYSKFNVTGWLGLGTRSLDEVPTLPNQSMDVDAFEEILDRRLGEGYKVPAIIVSAGTTDAFAFDDLPAIVSIRDRLAVRHGLDYQPHIHADAVIGWAWSVFRSYDFETNPLGFPPGLLAVLSSIARKVEGLALVDSIGCDFNKTGYAPNTASMFLCRNKDDLGNLARDSESAPYLFHTGSYRPGLFTLEASRSGYSALSVLANLELLGREGMRTLLAQIVAMALDLRERLAKFGNVQLLNAENDGPAVLYRVYPPELCAECTFEREGGDSGLLTYVEAFNRSVSAELATRAHGGGPLVSFTDCVRRRAGGEPVSALKSFVISPFADTRSNERLVATLAEVVEDVAARMPLPFEPASACPHAPAARATGG